MEKLIEYLKDAKEKQWTIDRADLCVRFNVTMEQVKKAINKIFN